MLGVACGVGGGRQLVQKTGNTVADKSMTEYESYFDYKREKMIPKEKEMTEYSW